MDNTKPVNKKCNSKKCSSCEDNDCAQEVNYKDLYIQTLADYQNLQKRNVKDVKRTQMSTKRDIINEFINVYDAAKTGAKYNEQGPLLIFNAFKKSLRSLNITIINDDFLKNQESINFNDNYFYAVIETPTADESLNGKINEIISDGFYDDQLKETLVYAKVSVFKYSKNENQNIQ